jgi:hypothetical protein
VQTSGTPKRAKYAFVASKATKSAFLRSEVPTGWYRLVPLSIGLSFFHFAFCIFPFFASGTRDAHDPSRGTGQKSKNINNDGLWDGGTGPEGVGRGATPCSSSSFSTPYDDISPNCSQLHLIAPKFNNLAKPICGYPRLTAANRAKIKNYPPSICVHRCPSVVNFSGLAAVNGTNRQQTAPRFKKFYVSYRLQCIKLVKFAMFAVASQLIETWNLELLWSLELGAWRFR